MRKRMLTFIPILSMALLLQGCPNKTTTRSTSEKESKDTLVSEESIEEETKGTEEQAPNSDATEDSKESETTTESTTEATTTSETEKETHILKEYIRHYSSSGTYSGGSEIEYDESGNEMIIKKFDKNNNVEGRIEFEYDVNGNELKQNRFNSNGVLYEYFEHEYDSDGNCIRMEWYNVIKEKVKELKTWEYDVYGNKIREYGDNGSLCKEWEYDDLGRMITEVEYSPNGSIKYYWVHEYDSAGNLIKKEYSRVIDSDVYYDTYTWEYDSNGNQVVEEYTSNFAQYRDEMEYDFAGNKIQEIRYSEEGGKILHNYTWTYEYDDKGNITLEKRNWDGDIDWTEYEYVYSD